MKSKAICPVNRSARDERLDPYSTGRVVQGRMSDRRAEAERELRQVGGVDGQSAGVGDAVGADLPARDEILSDPRPMFANIGRKVGRRPRPTMVREANRE